MAEIEEWKEKKCNLIYYYSIKCVYVERAFDRCTYDKKKRIQNQNYEKKTKQNRTHSLTQIKKFM